MNGGVGVKKPGKQLTLKSFQFTAAGPTAGRPPPAGNGPKKGRSRTERKDQNEIKLTRTIKKRRQRLSYPGRQKNLWGEGRGVKKSLLGEWLIAANGTGVSAELNLSGSDPALDINV